MESIKKSKVTKAKSDKKTPVKPNHSQLHSAIRSNNLHKLKNLLQKGVKPCISKTRKNCYILAHENKNGEFLKTLLEHDNSGIHATDQNGDSLLIRDISQFKCQHFELLLQSDENDVNYVGNNYLTALHHAIKNKETDISVIKQLILKKADLNAVDLPKENGKYINGLGGETPLSLLIKNYNETINGFDKIKLLFESGASNMTMSWVGKTVCDELTKPALTGRTDDDDLLIAKNKVDFNLIQYLVEKNVSGIHMDRYKVHFIKFFDKGLATSDDGIKNYLIPALDTLIKAGYDLYRQDNFGKTALCYVLKCFQDVNTGHGLFAYVLQLVFSKLNDFPNYSYNCIHPVISFFIKVEGDFSSDSFVKSQIQYVENSYIFDIFIDLISKYQNKIGHFMYLDFYNFFQNAFRTEKHYFGVDEFKSSYLISPIGAAFLYLPISAIKPFLLKCKKQNYQFSKENGDLYTILSIRYLQTEVQFFKSCILAYIDFLLKNGVQLHSKNNIFELDLETKYKIPECFFLGVFREDQTLLRVFLPDLHTHPLAVILYIKPWQEGSHLKKNFILWKLRRFMQILIELGGLIPQTSEEHRSICTYINTYINLQNLSQPRNLDDSLLKEIISQFNNATDRTIKLQFLCRDVIREVGMEAHCHNFRKVVEDALYIPTTLAKIILKDV